MTKGRSGKVSFAALLTRVVLGATILADGALKLGAFDGPGIARFTDRLAGHGFPVPHACAWTITAAELSAGLALVLGAFPTVAATVAATVLIGTWWFESSRAWFVGTGGVEYKAALLALAVGVWAHGPGAWAWDVSFERKKDGAKRG